MRKTAIQDQVRKYLPRSEELLNVTEQVNVQDIDKLTYATLVVDTETSICVEQESPFMYGSGLCRKKQGLLHSLKWDEDDKEQFFNALSRCGKHNPEEIARRIGKNVISVMMYLDLLESELNYYKMIGTVKSLDLCEFPSAREMSDQWLEMEESQSKFLCEREQREALMTADVENYQPIPAEVLRKLELFHLKNALLLAHQRYTKHLNTAILRSTFVSFHDLIRDWLNVVINDILTLMQACPISDHPDNLDDKSISAENNLELPNLELITISDELTNSLGPSNNESVAINNPNQTFVMEHFEPETSEQPRSDELTNSLGPSNNESVAINNSNQMLVTERFEPETSEPPRSDELTNSLGPSNNESVAINNPNQMLVTERFEPETSEQPRSDELTNSLGPSNNESVAINNPNQTFVTERFESETSEPPRSILLRSINYAVEVPEPSQSSHTPNVAVPGPSYTGNQYPNINFAMENCEPLVPGYRNIDFVMENREPVVPGPSYTGNRYPNMNFVENREPVVPGPSYTGNRYPNMNF
ncbi:5232_t:CDS:2, partial [Ambispora leptoticha]